MKSKKDNLQSWLEDGQRIADYYNSRIASKGGVSSAALDWRTDEEHMLFLQHALEHIDLKEVNTVYDAGCGDARCMGMLMKLKDGSLEYSGVDVVESFISEGRKKYPHSKISVNNFIDPKVKVEGCYDLVINLGGLNSRVSHHLNYIAAVVEKMICFSGRYVVFNVIVDSDQTYFPKGNQFAVGHISSFAKKAILEICDKLASEAGWRYHVEYRVVFPGSTDMFVTFFSNENN